MRRRFALFVLLLAAVVPCFAGTTYTFTTRTEADGSQSAMQTRVWATSDSLKMLFVQSDDPGTPASSYILRPTRTSPLYLVDPDKKTYVRWDPEQSLRGASSNFEVLNARFEKVSETPGDTVAGFRTTHYVFRLTYTMRSEVFGHRADTPVTVEQEYWVADHPRLNDIRSANLIESQATGMSQLGPELQRAISEQTAKLRGIPLKTVMRFIISLPAREQQTTMTSEISDVKTVAVSATTFRIPSGYRRVAPKVAAADDEP